MADNDDEIKLRELLQHRLEAGVYDFAAHVNPEAALLTSVAISLVRIANSLEGIERASNVRLRRN